MSTPSASFSSTESTITVKITDDGGYPYFKFTIAYDDGDIFEESGYSEELSYTFTDLDPETTYVVRYAWSENGTNQISYVGKSVTTLESGSSSSGDIDLNLWPNEPENGWLYFEIDGLSNEFTSEYYYSAGLSLKPITSGATSIDSLADLGAIKATDSWDWDNCALGELKVPAGEYYEIYGYVRSTEIDGYRYWPAGYWPGENDQNEEIPLVINNADAPTFSIRTVGDLSFQWRIDNLSNPFNQDYYYSVGVTTEEFDDGATSLPGDALDEVEASTVGSSHDVMNWIACEPGTYYLYGFARTTAIDQKRYYRINDEPIKITIDELDNQESSAEFYADYTGSTVHWHVEGLSSRWNYDNYEGFYLSKDAYTEPVRLPEWPIELPSSWGDSYVEPPDSGFDKEIDGYLTPTIGTHTIYAYLEVDDSFGGGTLFFPVGSITFTIGGETIVPLWDWNINNGDAGVVLTQKAYSAITKHGPISDFSHLVWNDLCNKVALAWEHTPGTTSNWATDDDNLAKADTLMNPDDNTDRNLTAARFNALRYNIGRNVSTGINPEWIQPGQPVKGQYFIALTTALNEWIESLPSE